MTLLVKYIYIKHNIYYNTPLKNVYPTRPITMKKNSRDQWRINKRIPSQLASCCSQHS